MADDISDKTRRSKKKRSSLLTWKKKFNIKKRFTNKLPLHRRHVRALMSGWSISDVRSVLTQYGITEMLKELSLMADKSHLPCSTRSQDLEKMYKNSSCCDIKITSCGLMEDECLMSHDMHYDHCEFKGHRALLVNRWPYLNSLLKAKFTANNRELYHDVCDDPQLMDDDLASSERKGAQITSVHVYGVTDEKLFEILFEVYHGQKSGSLQSHPRKLLPLPTTDDSFHIRNSKGKQTFRHTILECDPPPVTRRNVARRKHNKHRFSMDERILSKHSGNPVPFRMQQIKANETSPETSNSGAWNFGFDDESQKHSNERNIPNSLQDDVARMYNDAKSGCGDLKITFSLDSSSSSCSTPYARRREFGSHHYAWNSHYESFNFFHSPSRECQEPLYCHRVILAARSPYFRKLIAKQTASPTWWNVGDDAVCAVEIDGGVIPPRYMSAVLHTMYTDKVDLLRLYERVGQGGMPMSGVPVHFHLRDAIMLHLIGSFIEFPQLVHGCEEFIVSSLDQNNLLQVLEWASLPDGSEWVKRQVINFMREHFTELPNVLYELDASQIVEVLRSDFVNASELDILKCALRWGEHELERRIKREPNLVANTAQGASRSKTASARRRELVTSRTAEELHECTAPVLACVRMQHVLPPNHELYSNAVKRGVISRPPTDLLENVSDRESCSRQWIKSRVDFVPPRLFQPYVDETKNILDERFAQESDCVSLRSMHSFSRDQTWCSVRHQMELASHGVPDALYMVGHVRPPTRRRYGNRDLHVSFTRSRLEATGQKASPAKYIGDFYPVPDIFVLREMMARERDLKSTYVVNKVLRACIGCCHNLGSSYGLVGSGGRTVSSSNGANSTAEDLDETEHCNRCTALRLVRLFVVRERGFPDCAADLLHRPELYYTFNELRGMAVADASRNLAMMRPKRTSRVFPTGDSDSPRKRPQDSAVLERDNRLYMTSSVSHPPAYKDPPMPWKKPDSAVNFSAISSSRILNCNISPTFHPESVSDSSSLSEQEEVFRVRRKRKSLSRKGSSSAASYQSIPDVAASANSSLQRLRDSTHKIVGDLSDSPLAGTSSPIYHPTSPTRRRDDPDRYDFTKLTTETETCESSASSNEENTSENDALIEVKRFENETFIPSSNPQQAAVNVSMRSDPNFARAGGKQPNSGDRRREFHSPRIPHPANVSELFRSTLNFIDDHSDSSDDNLSELLRPDPGNPVPNSPQLDVPELVKDGTLPRSKAEDANVSAAARYEKPDIYPAVGGDSDCALEDQCGKYFFCSLTREKASESNMARGSTKGGASFSFAINYEKPDRSRRKCSGKNEGENADNETIFL